MSEAGIVPVELAAKEGLALNNGTQMMTAVGVNVLWDAMQLLKVADIAYRDDGGSASRHYKSLRSEGAGSSGTSGPEGNRRKSARAP